MGMTPKDAAYVLAVAGTFDNRMKPASAEDAQAKAVAWAAALAPDMDPEWAQKAVVAHYATSDKALMPAHLNDHWARYRREYAEHQRRQRAKAEAEQAETLAVPMPDFVRNTRKEVEKQ